MSHFKNWLLNTPMWGGEVCLFNSFHNLKLVNTCTIDYFLYFLWVAYNTSNAAQSFIDGAALLKHIIHLISAEKWSLAKITWMYHNGDVNKSNSIINVYGTLYDKFLKNFNQLCPLTLSYECNCGLEKILVSEFYYTKESNISIPISIQKKKCSTCTSLKHVQIFNVGPIMLIENFLNISFNQIAQRFGACNKEFKLRSAVCYKAEHFVGVLIDHDSKKYILIDDLDSSPRKLSEEDFLKLTFTVFCYFQV